MRLDWDENRGVFESGVDRGVLYPTGGRAVAWNGLISVTEKPTGAGEVPYFIDGVKYLRSMNGEEFQATIEAFYYPDEFEDLSTFGLSYRTEFGDGHKLHLVFNGRVIPSDKNTKSEDASADLTPFSWDISTMPIAIQNSRRSAHLVIDTIEASPVVIELLENMLYGTSDTDPTFPSYESLLQIFVDNAILTIIVDDDGSWTAIGPDEAINVYEDGTFEITWPSVVYISEDTYTISTW